MTDPRPPIDQPPEPVVDETLTPLEAAFYTLLLRKLVAWLKKVAQRVMFTWRQWRMLPNPQEVWAVASEWTDEVDELVDWLSVEAVPHGWDRFEIEWTGRSADFVSTDAFTQAHLAHVKNFLVRIPDEVYNGIFAEISDGINEGESVEQIAERVDNFLNVTGSENWPNRARVISITEVNGAANAGWMAAALQTEQLLGQRLSKKWIATKDKATRASHREANGQVRPLLEPFMVGGYPLMYPGDKAGPPQEVINCRCAAATEGVQ